MNSYKKYFPILSWGAQYNRNTLVNDLVVACIVTVMLIPQSLAYALLAGLPPEVGLYASMAPLILYAIFGTSRALAVGPVAVGSLMTAAAVSKFAEQGTPEYLGAAIALAMVSGLLLILMGFLRLGFLANFLSHPIMSGFITASAIQIAASQLAPILGISAHGETFVSLVVSLFENVAQVNPYTAAIGLASLVFLFWVRNGLKPLLLHIGLGERPADILTKVGPIAAIVITTIVVWSLELSASGVRIVGTVPQGLPSIAMPPIGFSLWLSILVPALLLSVVGYVESISVAFTLAAKKRQHIDPDQELIALGASNVGSAMSGGLPVTGGFSRSIVNFDAGAETPAAGAFTAVGIAIVALFLTPLLYFLPNATLAATIIVAVMTLVDLKALKHTWAYSRADGAAMTVTILLTLMAGVEAGLIAGVGLSIFLHLYRTSKPHVAIVGQLPGTEHFRNKERHAVVIDPTVLSLRVDASFYFPNARFLENVVNDAVSNNEKTQNVILVCSSVNTIDASALESLIAINQRLKDGGISLHLSEVKGPIMDALHDTELLVELTGQVHLSQFHALNCLSPELTQQTLADRD
ncbi:sodium-independent anion transporter [Vibrio breoganii]|uniref:SulP family inorganic anion transporter n=1 Tax=Vibrio breoganii TaxID=553239 RepID=UPI000C859C5C|nr:sulfate permease [Vibrio breoganii]PML02680.1 sodium-independent anion transporter [Vibrio breoganii]